MFKKSIVKFIRRFRISNYHYYVPFRNKVNLACNARKTSLYIWGGKGNQILVDDSVEMYELDILVYGNNNVLTIKENAYVRGRIELMGNGNHITIGERTTIGGGLLMAHYGTNLSIGKDCLISGGIDMRTSDSHSILDENGKRINPDKDIFVDDRVWFGKDVTVLKGSKIGKDVVIGALSLVSKSIPDNTVAAGIPARVIKEKTSWCQEII